MEKVAFLYATFPRPTETFVRRELRAFDELGFHPIAYSLWGGEGNWEKRKIILFPKFRLFQLFYWLPYWGFLKPREFREVLTFLWNRPCPNLQNFNETFLGLGFALVEALAFRKKKYDLIHGVWATMPATAAFALHKLTGIPYSMDSHAYDLFRKGGDWLLELKLRYTAFVRTSSESSVRRLESLGVEGDKIQLIRRGLESWTKRSSFEVSPGNEPLRMLSVGRLVPKKGYFHTLRIAEILVRNRISFEWKIIGSGILEKQLKEEIKRKGLENWVHLLGFRMEEEVRETCLQSDVLVFTGIIDECGDRDGIPNIVPEAMETGCLILSSQVAGASEAFIDEVSGFSLNPKNPHGWVEILSDFKNNPSNYLSIRKNAIKHAREHFDVRKTVRKLYSSIQRVPDADG